MQLNITPLDVNGIKVISLLLHHCDPGLINIGFHNAVGQLVESLLGVKDELLEAVYQYIVFNFEIWSNADISVQIAHTQLLCTYIKDDPAYFEKLFNIDFFLNIVQNYYCRGPQGVNQRKQILTETEERDLRTALLGITFIFNYSYNKHLPIFVYHNCLIFVLHFILRSGLFPTSTLSNQRKHRLHLKFYFGNTKARIS